MSAYPCQAQNVIKNLLFWDMRRGAKPDAILSRMYYYWDTPVLEYLLNSNHRSAD